MKKIILASQSTRRQDLLRQAGIPFIVMPSRFDEDAFVAGMATPVPPPHLALALSMEKARAVAKNVKEPAIIIGADTIVTLDGIVMGKPKDAAEAFAMLKALQGVTHHVYTGVTLIDGETKTHITRSAAVTMRPLTDSDIIAYIKTGEPFDKAGGYGIQEKGAVLVEKIDGDYYAVVGLPLAPLWAALTACGYDTLGLFEGSID